MTFREQVSVIRSWLWFIVPAAILGASIAVGVSSTLPARYSSHVGLVVAPPLTRSELGLTDVLLGEELTPTFARLAVSRPVLDAAITAANVPTNADDLAPNVSTHVPEGSNLLDVTVAYRDPAGAAALANAIGARLAEYFPPGQPTSNALVLVTVVDPASPPRSADGPRPIESAVLGAVIGLGLALAVAFLVANLRRPPARPVSGRGSVDDADLEAWPSRRPVAQGAGRRDSRDPTDNGE
jgi:capsular polysaccharide biosynthesis protein